MKVTAMYRDFDSDKKILITGSAGFIGFHLAKKLLELGAEVVGFDNCNAYYNVSLKERRLQILQKYDQFKFIKGDLADEQAISNLFAVEKPAIVVNLAAQAGVRYSIENPRCYLQSNIIGFFNLLECCRKYQTEHLVFASSSSVYGNQQKTPFSTTDNVDHPISFYAATKKADELMAYTYSRLYKIPVTGLRFFTVYGPYGRPDMAYFKFAELISAGKPIKIYNHGNMLRDFTYIDDIVEGIRRILGRLPQADVEGVQYKLYNIGNNHPVKLLDFIETLERALGKTALKEYLPMQPGDVYQTYADISELERDFDFRPQTNITEGLRHFAEWYQQWKQRSNI